MVGTVFWAAHLLTQPSAPLVELVILVEQARRLAQGDLAKWPEWPQAAHVKVWALNHHAVVLLRTNLRKTHSLAKANEFSKATE